MRRTKTRGAKSKNRRRQVAATRPVRTPQEQLRHLNKHGFRAEKERARIAAAQEFYDAVKA